MIPLVVPQFSSTLHDKVNLKLQHDAVDSDDNEVFATSGSNSDENDSLNFSSHAFSSILQVDKLHGGFFTSGYMIPSSNIPCNSTKHTHNVI